MKIKLLIIFPIAILLLSGCNSLDKEKKKIEEENREINKINQEERQVCINAGGVPIRGSGWQSERMIDCKFK